MVCEILFYLPSPYFDPWLCIIILVGLIEAVISATSMEGLLGRLTVKVTLASSASLEGELPLEGVTTGLSLVLSFVGVLQTEHLFGPEIPSSSVPLDLLSVLQGVRVFVRDSASEWLVFDPLELALDLLDLLLYLI